MNKKIFSLTMCSALLLGIFLVGFSLNTHEIKAQKEENNGNGNGRGGGGDAAGFSGGAMYGWAWGATDESSGFGVGWISLNSCKDDDRDGVSDPWSCGTSDYSVVVDHPSGNISGHAWSNNVGWISFNRSETLNPPGDDPGSGSGPIAKIQMNGSDLGQVKGWGRALAAMADTEDGWDGWIHLSDNSSSPSRHPGGPSYIAGDRGVTFNPSTGSVVGYAWGSEVLGWIKFVNVTLGSPPQGVPFDYNLTNSGSINLVPGGQPVTVRVTRNLLSGASQPVTIGMSTSFPPRTGVSVNVSSTNNPCTPNQNCFSEITFSASASAPEDNYNVTVVGSPSVGTPSAQPSTTFRVSVNDPGDPTMLQVSCGVSTNPPYLVNRPVGWEASVSGGTAPYTVDWLFKSPPGAPTSVTANGSGPTFNIDKIYDKVGLKTTIATVTDSSIPPRVGACEETAPINVVVDPEIREI